MRAFRFAAEQDVRIPLTQVEKSIFQVILDVNKARGLNTTFRVAGGWVRDKLLGKQSDDIDIALDNLTGRQFEAHLAAYAQGHPDAGLGRSYTVDANVEKSKHLETVGVYIHGLKVDFVNLRTETYGETRVPTMGMGTPEVDAQRRDLTINALFYNINTGVVEDYVGGLADLRAGILKTPLDPKKTFLDDPLRMLRVLRFGSKFGFRIDPEVAKALSDPSTQEAYRKKVAPNRAGPEVMKMMAGQHPAEALGLMLRSGMYKSVFDIPEVGGLGTLDVDQKNKHHAHTVLEHTLQVIRNMNDLMQAEGYKDDRRALMNMAALFHDFGKVYPGIAQPQQKDPSQMSYKGHEDKSAEVAEAALRHIGVGDHDRQFVGKVVSLHMRPHVDEWTPKAMRRFLREEAVLKGQDELSKDMWKFVMLHGIADEMSKGIGDPAADVAMKRLHMQQFDEMQRFTPAPLTKPLLNGNDLMAMFPALKPNVTVDVGGQKMTFIKDLTARLLEQQDAGTVTTREQAVDFVQGLAGEVQRTYGRPKTAQVTRWSIG
jgi:tRNA nucleotidyltransferase/poly(A) polymerase